MKEKDRAGIYKGMREFPPEKHKHLEAILDGWVQAAKAFGFLQYKTPLLDPQEIYEGKTSQEILDKQIYSFTDRSDRNVVIRPELTPGVSVMVAGLQREIKKPYKVFSIGSVFRYEKSQKGREREHIQFNVDIFGEKDLWADAEVIEVAFASLKAIGFNSEDFEVRINDREAIEQSLLACGVAKETLPEVMRLLDKQDKEDVQKELRDCTQVSLEEIDKALTEEPEKVTTLRKLLSEGIQVKYDSSIIRGFDYYTGIIFEIYIKDKETSRSIAGGGRYDKLIESYSGTPLPAVGFGMGDVRLLDAMETLSCNPGKAPSPPIVVFVTEEDQMSQALFFANQLRTASYKDKKLPIFFVGLVDERKLGDFYKNIEKRWENDTDGPHTLYIKAKNRYILRNLANWHEETIENPSINDSIDAIVRNV